ALVRWIGRRADLLHASSPELAESLASFGIPPSKITVIPLGTDASEFHPRTGPREPGPARIVCTRKHYPLYDNDTIVRALALLRGEGLAYRCRFAGSGPSLEQTKRIATQLGLSDSIEFLGDLAPSQIPTLLRWADIYVSAARSDGAPSSLF